ncbi:hypothetical protein QFC19_001229 [Naganishia cerealis]|uniref:Uncharacterized protein n=1 Tax=Naganishia cerealis TaxID=610337 RepID=A0ACC2WI85_9TREE|nr:hypothetical protein QFC19_001229 [Naganishia cerealis]
MQHSPNPAYLAIAEAIALHRYKQQNDILTLLSLPPIPWHSLVPRPVIPLAEAQIHVERVTRACGVREDGSVAPLGDDEAEVTVDLEEEAKRVSQQLREEQRETGMATVLVDLDGYPYKLVLSDMDDQTNEQRLAVARLTRHTRIIDALQQSLQSVNMERETHMRLLSRKLTEAAESEAHERKRQKEGEEDVEQPDGNTDPSSPPPTDTTTAAVIPSNLSPRAERYWRRVLERGEVIDWDEERVAQAALTWIYDPPTVESAKRATAPGHLLASFKQTIGSYPQWAGQLCWNSYDTTNSTGHTHRHGRVALRFGGGKEQGDPGIGFCVVQHPAAVSDIVPTPTERATQGNGMWHIDSQLPSKDLLPRESVAWQDDVHFQGLPGVAVQITTFVDGGYAVSVKVCHALADATTLLTFMHDWTRTNRAMAAGDTALPALAPVFHPSLWTAKQRETLTHLNPTWGSFTTPARSHCIGTTGSAPAVQIARPASSHQRFPHPI